MTKDKQIDDLQAMRQSSPQYQNTVLHKVIPPDAKPNWEFAWNLIKHMKEEEAKMKERLMQKGDNYDR